MMNIPEAQARPYAPYVILVNATENETGMHYHFPYACIDFRGVSQILHRIRTGAMFTHQITVRRVYLCYNVVELPVPIEGIPGSAQ